MPSLPMMIDSVTPETLKKEKKIKSETLDSDTTKKEKSSSKKEKSSSKKEKSSSKKDKDEKKKKRKAVDLDDLSDKSDTSSELVQAVDLNPKKAKIMEVVDDDEIENPYSLSNFRLSKPLKDALISKGIKALFPIQAMTFNDVFDGCDLVGRARTGQGKTLAFVLPIVESLVNGRTKALRKTGHGRLPSVLVLLPTRELATQVLADFQVYGGAVGLSACSVYGGAPFHSQISSLNRGVDIVVGTPGRVKDLLEKGVLKLGSLLFRVLDEADEMLKMGFMDDVKLILEKVDDFNKVQTLLFSATLPNWVKEISRTFLKPAKKTIDLVSDQKMKASTSVRHIVIPCSSSAMADLIPDIIRCYASGGRSIVFTETKEFASRLSGLLTGARPLHGDIQQTQREVTLKGFRSGKFMTLVATNVAARGLDINDVQLIIQCEPPRDVEAYIHRSGRTGRAGNTGIAVMLYDPKKASVNKIERDSGVKFEHLSAPQPADVAKAVGVETAEAITQISNSVIPSFKDAAEELLSTSGLSAVEIIAKALAKAAGYSDIKERSLLTGMEGCVTLLLEVGGKEIYNPTFVYTMLKRFLPEQKANEVMGVALTADKRGAVFDVQADDLETFLVGSESATGVSLDVVKTLPPLEERDMFRGRQGYGGGSRFGGRGGRGGGYSDRRYSSNGYGGGRGRGRR
ncbi:DEAD-box ATP-dependent RNA helicase 7-like [Chenopodium quinoa]|uniref:DEAD-box ATP-dependent RNA helicase 7-like n=1 Tax=Chenopodium quinoa TaxID=63459 RepID=UPI000B780889|nr:DEAD-box ATP-dependent RNA helicase 7-like [Chenopodium quinoa]